MTEILRKSAQEVEIDHLLAEEFCCDLTFGERFLAECGLLAPGFHVVEAIPEPSLGGEGFGDLLVKGSAQSKQIALLIEDKITAQPGVRQAERYRRYAQRLRGGDWDAVYCILVAPAAYGGERDLYDCAIPLEAVAELIEAADPVRRAYRRKIIQRAIAKKNASGVQVPDPAMHSLRSQYLKFAEAFWANQSAGLTFPWLRRAYYDGDSWIEPIRHRMMPAGVWLRHRLWTSVHDPSGRVDLVFSPIEEKEKARLLQIRLQDGIAEDYGSKKDGLQISLRVPEMRQSDGFNELIAREAFDAMKRLLEWYEAARPSDAPDRD
ncbi:hypothetical protein [Afifella marina]|uniref:PD-(D/E)XK nuclease superfamily protein n=1 Tax=Afifella marina DSM 2698 TaxID=1120955 RepID=A0A1G5NBC6_AFIMA|nr:hypothetical protein [Afifella marina]MBK1623217.1 hypothetical protein [Afifella marina DSM 2698]MBK1626211.1 hypothetical protein [Afifella marina]MBK5917089.1 hypothetical protein [Afifella marina]RAI22079.1 hypothetical protein CH311_05055 [Afifella marina DSM 2698]SCZ34713.1 hypothetical protein SAMN03080610_01751 [Afifella marina DSM 2698]